MWVQQSWVDQFNGLEKEVHNAQGTGRGVYRSREGEGEQYKNKVFTHLVTLTHL